MTTNTDLHGAMPELPEPAAVPEGLPQAVLTLNAAWNRKEPEEAIAGHMDLCRRLALAAPPSPKQGDLPAGCSEVKLTEAQRASLRSTATYIPGIATSPAPPIQQPALGRGEGGGVPLTLAQIDLAVRNAQIAYALDKFTSFEVALARKVEAAHGIKEAS